MNFEKFFRTVFFIMRLLLYYITKKTITKNANKEYILLTLTRTDYLKIFSLKKTFTFLLLLLLDILENLQENHGPTVMFWKDYMFPLRMAKNVGESGPWNIWLTWLIICHCNIITTLKIFVFNRICLFHQNVLLFK